MATRMSIPHYIWGGGHAVVLLTSLYCLVGVITFKPHPYAYKLAFSGALLSWGIVVYKSLGVPTLNRAYINRALQDENVQYLLLALYWNLVEKPIPLTLIPFATFSLFHTLTFVRSLLPKPPVVKKTDKADGTSASAAPAQSASAQLSKRLQTWIKSNYERAMTFVSYWEVIVIMGRVSLGAITFKNSLMSPLFFAQFLRLRYYMSPQTRAAFSYVSAQIDTITAHPSCPGVVRTGMNVARDLVRRYSSSVLQQGQPAGNAGADGNANAAAAAR